MNIKQDIQYSQYNVLYVCESMPNPQQKQGQYFLENHQLNNL